MARTGPTSSSRRRRCRRSRRKSSSSRWTPASDLAKAPGDAEGWLGPYAREPELVDPWKNPYTYKVPGENAPFDLASLGADGKVGGSSVAADIAFK